MKYGLTCNGKLLTTDYSNILGFDDSLPQYTLRVQYQQNTSPQLTRWRSLHSEATVTDTLIDSDENIYDITTSIPDWSFLFDSTYGTEEMLINVISVNSENITNMSEMFARLRLSYFCTIVRYIYSY